MTFTHSLPDAVFCYLLALPISLAKVELFPIYNSNKQSGCECAKQQFTCDPFGNSIQFNTDYMYDESWPDADTLGGDRPICYSYPKQNGYIIQQKCQKNYPGGNVIATPVPCEVNGCNDYYKSMQPDRNRTMSFYDQCNAGLDGWTCCLDSSSYLSGDSLASLSPKKTSKKSKK